MQGEKGGDSDISALFRISCRNREAGVGSRLAGAVSALVEAFDSSGRPGLRAAGAFLLAGVALSGCAQQPSAQTASNHRYHGHEHFAEGEYGKASPRMVADGEAIPRGGGQYLVGHPYSVHGRTYYPTENEHYVGVGTASWYGDAFHGRKTANGEIYDKNALSAAHPTMPLPSYARVTNLGNGYSVIVRVNDRGPYAAGRVMDVSSRVADVLDFKNMGTAHVKVEYVGRAPLEGSDDNELLSSLRTDGGAADFNGGSSLVAEATSPLVALFGGKSEPPPPPPPPPPPVPPPAPARATVTEEVAPSPPRVERSEADEETRGADIREMTAPPRAAARAPLPPVRPYDLGGVREAAFVPKPPSRHPSDSNRALYYTSGHPAREDPLARLLSHTKTHSLLDDDDR
jgi:rare lipoprotein A